MLIKLAYYIYYYTTGEEGRSVCVCIRALAQVRATPASFRRTRVASVIIPEQVGESHVAAAVAAVFARLERW